ncbi:MAG: hypothetical protein Q9204_004455 [Flavoplaca sp. TL-2023a]
MYSSCLLLLFASSSLVSADVAATITRDGVTSIYGNSFGVPGVEATYDYVVIGGGTAGNTVAARLAQDPANYSVAVIEAGSFYEILNGNYTQVPGYSYTSALSTSDSPHPTAGSLNRWADLVGDQAWAWDNVYPYFKKSCNFTPPNYEKISPSANISFDPDAFIPNAGPLQVSYGNYQYPYGTPFSRGLERLGFRSLAGINSGELIGYSAATSSVDARTATRSSSETAFLQDAAQTTGIKIYPNALAKSILFDNNKRATGVVVQGASALQNITYTLSASREVVLSAGALRNNFSNSTRAFLDTFPSDWPDAEYLPLVYAPFPDNISSTDNYLLIGSALLSTSSRGNMTIRSTDTLDPPIISPNWLLDEGDQEQAVAAFLRIREIAAASGVVESEYEPGANVSTQADILQWLKNNMNLIYHAASSCKMGRANDTTAVVDSHARVRGVSNLRVVDASAFPILPPGQPQAVVCKLFLL